MTVYVVYRQKEYIKYFNHFFSRSTFFVFVFTVIPLFVSGIAAYRAYGFYTTSVYIPSQPVVNLQQDMVVSFLTTSAVYTWSNLQQSTSNCIPTISIAEIDANLDGIKESLNMTVKLYKPNIVGVRLLLQFGYSVSTAFSTVAMQQAIAISADVPQPSAGLAVMGSLGVNQRRRLPGSGVLTIYNNTYLSSSSPASILANPFDNLPASDAARNFTVKLKDVFTAWQPGANANVFTATIEIQYSPVVLQYHNDFWGMIKWAWVQWFYFLIFFMFFFQRFKEFVFESYSLSAKKRSTQLHRCENGSMQNTAI